MEEWYTIVLDMELFLVRRRVREVSWTNSQQIAFYKLKGTYLFAQMFGIFEIDGSMNKVGAESGLHRRTKHAPRHGARTVHRSRPLREGA